MRKSHTFKEEKSNNIDTNLVLNASTNSEARLHENVNSFDPKNDTKISFRATFDLHALQNLIIIESNEEILLELTQFIENKYANNFHISTFSNIVQALLNVNQNTSIFIFDCHYFDKASPKIIRFVKNRNIKTFIISQFDTKKIATAIDGFIKKRCHNLLEEKAIQIEINTSGLRQAVFPFHFSRWHHGDHKYYQYMILLLVIIVALFLLNL